MHLGDDRNRGLDEGNDDNGDDDKYDDDDNNDEGGDDDIKHDNDGDDVKVCDWVCSLAAWGRRRDLSLRSQSCHLLIPAITTDHKLSSVNRRMRMRGMRMMMIVRMRILFIPLITIIDKHEDMLVQN